MKLREKEKSRTGPKYDESNNEEFHMIHGVSADYQIICQKKEMFHVGKYKMFCKAQNYKGPKTIGVHNIRQFILLGLGVWDQHMKTITYSMDKQQGPTVQHKELYSISCDKP